MPDQALIDYVKQNTAAGFPEAEIRTALSKAGWEEPDIIAAFATVAAKAEPVFDEEPLPAEESFFDKYRRLLIIILITLVALPLLAFGGFWGYQKLFQKKAPPPAREQPAAQNQQAQEKARQETEKKAAADAAARDKQRLTDVQTLQEALDEHFLTKQLYPGKLNSLLEDKLLEKLPADPASQKPYLYTALGEPALNYTISFLLETDIGPLKSGLQVATPTNRVQADAVTEQNELIKGEITKTLPTLAITDLAAEPFYPQEEVALTITPPASATLKTAALVVGNLNLTDRRAPWGFGFSAPKNPGEYQVQVFAFDEAGQGYFGSTTLTVKN